MMRTILKFIFTLMLFSETAVSKDAVTNEHIVLITDRTVYAAGESLIFSASKSAAHTEDKTIDSKVLYFEIIDPNGRAICQHKFYITNYLQTTVQLPEDTESGIYFARAYTRWMRNFGAKSYAYVPVYICENILKPKLTSGISLIANSPENNDTIFFTNHQTTVFKTRSNAGISFNIPDNFSEYRYKILASVIPFGTSQNYHDIIRSKDSIPETISFFPELQGLTISGKLIAPDSGHKAGRIFCSILDSTNYFASKTTRSDGSFQFELPDRYGMHKVALTAASENGEMRMLLADNDYCTEGVAFLQTNLGEINLPASSLKMLLNNQQITKTYLSRPYKKTTTEPDTLLFFGKSDLRINIANYINMDMLEDYILELIPNLSVQIEKGKKTLHFKGDEPELNVFPPLLLVDGVCVNNLEDYLAIPPDRIKYIDILKRPVLRGSTIFGGVMSLTTNRNDFGGLDMMKYGNFYNFSFLSEPVYDTMQTMAEHIPDARNTLFYGAPVVQTKNRGIVQFITGDIKGKYDVQLYLEAEDGRYFKVLKTIEVQ